MTIQKYNYIETINHLVPSLYTDREELNFGVEEELSYKTLAYYLKLVENASSLFQSSAIGSISELQAKFVPANKLTRVTSDAFNDYVLAPLGYDWKDFTASSELVTFMEASGLSATILNSDYRTNQAFALWFSGDNSNVPGVSSLYPEVSTVGLAHDTLVDKLGLLHLLNSPGPSIASKNANHVELSSLASSLWSENLYQGKTVTEKDCLNVLYEYIWKNREYNYPSLNASRFMPAEFVSSTSQVSGETYLSGTQLLDAYKTSLGLWVDENMDSSPMVRDSLEVFTSSTLIPTKFANSGSLSKFLRALGYATYDIHHVVDSIGDLVDIDNCPPEFLDYLATLIGWKLIGKDVTEWRQQLRNAVTAYKMKGTTSGLDAVVEYIFDRNVFFPTSGLTETWESYLPNMIYYVLKTESFMTSATPGEVRNWVSFWRNTGSVKINHDPDNIDNTIRFAVDMLLQYLDNTHKLIHIKGRHWKESDMWKGIIDNPNSPNGFAHRGKIVEVPPWENDRFYSDSYITLDALESLSSIMVKSPDHGGLGVSPTASEYITNFCKDNLGLDKLPPMPGDRQRFKFHTSSLEVAPNTSSLPLRSNAFEDATILSDYWNRKSSTMILDINAEDADFAQKGNTKLNLENLRMLHQVFRDFVPLRVMVHSVITKNMADGGGSEQTNEGIFDGYGWGTGGLLPSATFCLQGDYSKQDAATNIANDTFTSGFSGLADGGVSAGTYQEGRFVPDVNSDFWAGVGVIPSRNASRARNLRYSLPGRFFSRNGRNSPHTMDFMNTYLWGSTTNTAASAGSFKVLSNGDGVGYAFSALETSAYQPKGWNFSSQSYFDTSSREFDTSNAVRANRTGHARPRWQSVDTGLQASAAFPFRAAERYSVNCSAVGAEERHRVFEVNRQIIDIILKEFARSGDRAVLNFNHEDMLDRSFGTGVHQLYRKYKNEFMNRLDDTGFSLLHHTFGPFLIGGDVPVRSIAIDGTLDDSQSHTPGRAPGVDDTISTRPEYKYIIGGDGIHSNVFYNSSGTKQLVESFGLASEEGLHAWKPDLDEFLGVKQYSNVSLLSAMEVVTSPVGQSFAVLNDSYSKFRVTDADSDTISLFSRGAHSKYEDCLKFKFPLLQKKNFISNPNFTDNPPSRTNLPLYALEVKGWDLADYARDPNWNNLGTNAGTLTVVDGSQGPFSPNPTITADASGNNFIVLVSKKSTVEIRNRACPTIRTNISPVYDTSSSDLKGVRPGIVPGKTYTLSLDVRSEVAVGKWAYRLTNVTKQENLATGTIDATSTTARETLTADIDIPTNYSPSDDYQLLLTYANGTGTAAKWSVLYKVSLKEKLSTESNTLMPDSKYRFSIKAKAAGVELENVDFAQKFALLGVRVCTDIITGSDGREQRRVFNFNTRKWDVMTQSNYTRDMVGDRKMFGYRTDMYTPGEQYVIKDSGANYTGWYHRMDEKGHIKFMSGRRHVAASQDLVPISDNHYVRETMRDGVMFAIPAGTREVQNLEFDFDTYGGSDIHNDDTGYYIEFFRVQGPNAEKLIQETRIDVHHISGYDLGLNELTSDKFNTVDYDREDVKVIMRYFNDIVSTYKLNSRNASDSSSLAGASGGGRSEMLTPFGGSARTNGDDGEALFGTGKGSTTVYEI